MRVTTAANGPEKSPRLFWKLLILPRLKVCLSNLQVWRKSKDSDPERKASLFLILENGRLLQKTEFWTYPEFKSRAIFPALCSIGTATFPNCRCPGATVWFTELRFIRRLRNF